MARRQFLLDKKEKRLEFLRKQILPGHYLAVLLSSYPKIRDRETLCG